MQLTRAFPSLAAENAYKPWWAAALWTMVLGYTAYFAAQTSLVHMTYATMAYDLGTFDQEIWLAGHSDELFVTVRGLHILGDHVRLFSFVLAPIYYIWNDVRMLLVLQTVFIAGGAVIIYLIGRREMPHHPAIVLALCAGYLLNPAVQNLNLEQAHPEAFASTFILASVYFVRVERYVLFWVAAALAMSCKEDIPLVYVALGVSLIAGRHRRLGTALLIVATTYFMVCMKLILPHFNEVGFFRMNAVYFPAAREHLLDPLWMIQRLADRESLTYLFALGLPVGFACMFSPAAMIPALPALAANLVSDTPYTRSVGYHYATSIVPFIYLSTLVTFGKLSRGWAGLSLPTISRRRGLAGEVEVVASLRRVGIPSSRARVFVASYLILCAVSANVAYSDLPLTKLDRLANTLDLLHTSPGIGVMDEALAQLPPNAAICADYTLVPHLSHRQRIYMFPNPFQAVYWGIAEQNPHDPDAIDYIVVRSSLLQQDEWGSLVDALVDDGRFHQIMADEFLHIYERVDRPAL